MKRCRALHTGFSLIASLLLAGSVVAEVQLFSADGYRISHYRSPT
ncbi:MAG TPA: sulfurtransferase, partial [Pseudomonas sp.]|nr:sulfurtransferase [Pseudomonas sp.]